jgi:hypothetical protein
MLMLLSPIVFAQGLVINEFLASNTITNTSPLFNKYDDWIELKNNSDSEINISGFYLSDDSAEPLKWKIPGNTVIPAKGFFIFWADSKDTLNHTNFKLSKDGEFIGLYTTGGSVVDSLTFGTQSDDISYGRTPEDKSVWAYFSKPTPGAENISDITGVSAAPEFSIPGGFYSGTQTLTITAGGTLTKIRYTTDGTPPSVNSLLYKAPIIISATTPIRARAYEPDKTPGEIITATYFINENINLPVISLVTDPVNFFSDTSGIYVTGTNGITGNCDVNTPRNVNQDWERPVHVEFYEKEGEQKINQDAGVKIFGGCSRTRYPQKSLALFARSQYGKGSFEYRFFSDKNIDKFESIVLRSSADDQVYTLFRDAAAQMVLAQDKDAEYQAYRPSVVYINGVYWGIHNIREKINEHYLASNYNVDEDNVSLLETSSSETPIVMAGNTDDYETMLSYISNNDMSKDINYEYVKTLMDIDNFINYEIGHIYFAEEDWPHGNVRYWKSNTGSGNYTKWHWINYDLDGSLFSYKITYDKLKMAIGDSVSWQNPEWSTLILKNLLKNPDFKNLFIQRFACLVSTIFDSSKVINIIDSLQNNIAAEIPHHIIRWGGQKDPDCDETWVQPTFNSVTEWQTYVEYMRVFARQRPEYVIQHIVTDFGLAGTATLTINPNINGAGKILVTGMPVPDSGYSAAYLQGVPVTIKAVPGYGYNFSYWKNGDSIYTKPEITISFTNDQALIAYFEPSGTADSMKVIINEINYSSAADYDTGDWIELYNRSSMDADLSFWILKDEKDDNVFTFAEGTTIKGHGYLVVCNNTNKFSQLVTGISNYTGDFNFGLSGSGELVRLFSSNGALIDSVHYNNKAPWPQEADGKGATLELISPDLDNDIASNWAAATTGIHGTPGVKNSTVTGVAETERKNIPEKFELLANYPNPFNPSTSITYRISEAGRVVLKIFDIMGREVKTLVDEDKTAGEYNVKFNAGNFASGVYYYQVRTKNNIATRKMMLLK